MADRTVSLVLAGRGTLTFPGGPDGPRWRTVRGGEPFAVPAELAEVLLADPNISVATTVPGTVTLASLPETKAPEPTPAAKPTKAELQARATELGIAFGSRATNAQLEQAIATAEEALAAAAKAAASEDPEPSGEDDLEGSQDPDADDEQDPTLGHRADPSTTVPGTVTLASLPAGARIQE